MPARGRFPVPARAGRVQLADDVGIARQALVPAYQQRPPRSAFVFPGGRARLPRPAWFPERAGAGRMVFSSFTVVLLAGAGLLPGAEPGSGSGRVPCSLVRTSVSGPGTGVQPVLATASRTSPSAATATTSPTDSDRSLRP